MGHRFGWVSRPGIFDTPFRLVAIGLREPPRAVTGKASDLRTMCAAGAATLVYLEASRAAPVSLLDHDTWCAALRAARLCVVRQQKTWWPSESDLTLPLCWGAEWLLRQWIDGLSLSPVFRAALIDAIVLVVYACHEALDRERDGLGNASDDRRVDFRLAGLDRLLARIRLGGLVIAATSAAFSPACTSIPPSMPWSTPASTPASTPRSTPPSTRATHAT